LSRRARVAIVGAGFGGSLIALIAARLGYDVLLTERGALPRFAIGESATPLADLILADLCDRYDLPALRPLCSWGAWIRELPHVGRGPKRGFTYFAHEPGVQWTDTKDNTRSLLVAASPDADASDCHWLRAEVDLHFLRQALAAGVEYRDETEVRSRADLGKADLIIDASGRSQALAVALGTRDATDRLRTRTRATWAHFEGVPPWTDAPSVPFPAEDAAVHHLLDGAWIWSLRFDHGVVSLGLVAPSESPERTWQEEVSRFPSLASWLTPARRITPRTSAARLQRLVTPAAGPDWAMLPSAAGFVDPLHSAGIAHTMRGVERLGRLLEDGLPLGSTALVDYGRTIEQELLHLDGLVAGCYDRLAARDTAGFFAFTKLYLVAAIISEHRRRANGSGLEGGFLLADDEAFVSVLEQARDADAAKVVALLRPLDPIGLCDPKTPNRIPFG
jgi:FADH2 O2-dependent halogenase